MLKKTLFASAILLIPAISVPAAVTPVYAQVNVKPKVNVAPRPRIRAVKPKIRLKVDPKRIITKKRDNTPADPTKQQAKIAEQPGPAGAAKVDASPDLVRTFGRFFETARIDMFRDQIKDIEEMLNIADLDGSSQTPGVSEWGESGGADGNNNDSINRGGGGNTGRPIGGARADGETHDGFGNPSDLGDSAGRGGAGAGPDYSGVAADLLGRVSSRLGSGDKIGTGVTAAPSPGGAVGGIASQTATLPTARDRGESGSSHSSWRPNDTGGKFRVTRTWNSQGTTVTIETITASGNHYTTRAHWKSNSNDSSAETLTVIGHSGKGSGDAGKTAPDAGKPKDIAKLLDPDSGGGVVVWIPPSCGSAACNAARELLGNPKGALQQVIDKGSRVLGDREGGGTGTTSRLVIDRHGLVVSYGADSGAARSSSGTPPRFTGPPRIQSD